MVWFYQRNHHESARASLKLEDFGSIKTEQLVFALKMLPINRDQRRAG